jgi:hypothetical protein
MWDAFDYPVPPLPVATGLFSTPACTSEEYLARASSYHPLLQIVNAYGKDHVLKRILNTMDIFIEIVTNPDGFAFTHSMVRIAGNPQQ